MDFVVDTNVLFTFFWERSFTRKLLIKQELDLVSPEFALEEINSHCDEILKKTDISLEEFKKLRKELAIFVEFIPLEEYSSFMEKASAIPDTDDIDFAALSLKLDCPIWSNDKELKQQSVVKIFSTSDLISFLSETRP